MKHIFLISMPSGGEWITIMIFFIVIGIIPGIFYILTLQNTLKVISESNRKMPPANVWLLLIPLFGIVWHFIVVSNIAQSIEAEYQSRNIQTTMKPTYGIGLAVSILNCISIIPIVNFVSGFAALVCWIIYWVQVSGHKERIFRLILQSNVQA